MTLAQSLLGRSLMVVRRRDGSSIKALHRPTKVCKSSFEHRDCHPIRVAIASRSCPQLDIPKIVDHSIKQDPTLAELPLPPPDLERSPYRSSPFDDEAPYEDSREFGIVPETQPSHVEEENTFQTDYIEADQPAYDSHDERDDVTPDRSRKSSKVSSAIAESNRVLHQALKPVPSISPSVFKPYLPKRPTLSQPASPIEEFESPVRRRGQSSRAVDVPLEGEMFYLF